MNNPDAVEQRDLLLICRAPVYWHNMKAKQSTLTHSSKDGAPEDGAHERAGREEIRRDSREVAVNRQTVAGLSNRHRA